MGAATCGGRGFKQRAGVSGERPIGAASIRKHSAIHCRRHATPPPPNPWPSTHAPTCSSSNGSLHGICVAPPPPSPGSRPALISPPPPPRKWCRHPRKMTQIIQSAKHVGHKQK